MIRVKFSLNNFRSAVGNLARKQQSFCLSFINSLMFSQYKITSIISLGFLIAYVQMIARILIRVPICRVYGLNEQICREMIFDFFYYFFIKYWFCFMKVLRDSTDYIAVNLLNGRHEKFFKIIIPIWYTIGFTIIYFLAKRIEFPRRRFQIVVVSTVHAFALSEIGPSSNLLIFDEQIPRIKSEREPAYKSQQSTSAEQIREKNSKIPRYSKSYNISTKNNKKTNLKENRHCKPNANLNIAVTNNMDNECIFDNNSYYYELYEDESNDEFLDAISFSHTEEITNKMI